MNYLTVKLNASVVIRYKEFNVPEKVAITTDKNGLSVYSWQVKHKTAIRNEPFSPDWHQFMTQVDVAPEKFLYDGVSGSFTNWKEMGTWINEKLLLNRDQLPPETAAFVKDLTRDINDPKLKAKKIYEYMQQKTHYISVQVGIGGYRPFTAADVDHLNYGDCKALVNYTKALLNAVDIKSWYCVVWGDRYQKKSLFNDFASMQGNHVILCIPFKNDTTWMDCTSQTIPFGYLGDFTDDRIVLACTPEGGKLLRTPKYTSQQNVESRQADFVIDNNGTITGNMKTIFKGVYYEDREEVINEADVERVKDIKRIYPINNFEVVKLAYEQDKGREPATTENIQLNARDYASANSTSLVFMLNPANRIVKEPARLKTRMTDVDIKRGYTQIDEVTYTLPAGYHLDTRNLDVKIEKPFGKFTATSTLTGNKLIYKRDFQLNEGIYSKDTYQDVVDFYSDIIDADSYTVTLAKN
jgi:hypothetical protein